VAAEFVALIGHPLFGWGDKYYAATPPSLVYHAPLPPSGADVLIRLAAAAQSAANHSAAAPSAPGAYAYVKRQSWQLADAGSGAPPPARVLPVVTESWQAPNGAGRVLRFIRGASPVSTQTAAGGSGRSLPPLSTSAPALAGRLRAAAPGTPGPAGQFVGLAKLTGDQPIPPRAEAVILELLARLPGLIDSGTVIDRDGRAGVAVSLESGASGELIRYTLIFAPATGALLEADQMLVGDPSAPDVRPDAMIAYTTFLAAGYVDSTTARP
jgi:hypothetical protein